MTEPIRNPAGLTRRERVQLARRQFVELIEAASEPIDFWAVSHAHQALAFVAALEGATFGSLLAAADTGARWRAAWTLDRIVAHERDWLPSQCGPALDALALVAGDLRSTDWAAHWVGVGDAGYAP